MAVRLNAHKREYYGKGYGQKIRSQGILPAVVYGKEIGELSIEIDLKEIKDILATERGRNTLIDLVVDESKEKHTVLVKDIQKDPIRGNYLHLDLHQISLKDEIHANVPIHLVGEPVGVKKGGILQLGQREVEVQCLPTEIPEQLEIDITNLDFGESITLEQIMLNNKVKVTSELSTVLATIVSPRLEPVDTTEEVDASQVKGNENDTISGRA
jgi:large subunit ribosomal protein L25